MERKSPLLMIFITIFIDLVGFGIIIPVMPYYVRSLGAGAFELGLLAASYSIFQFLFAPVLGAWSDRVGRKPVLAISMAGTALASVLMGIADTWGGLGLLFFARSVAGLTAANISTAQAYIADVTPPEKRAQGMGLVGMAFGLGFVLGPAIGGVLSHNFGVTVPFYAVAALAAANATWMWFKLPEPERHVSDGRALGRAQQLLSALMRRETSLPIIVFFVVTAAFANLETTLALLVNDRFSFTPDYTGYLFGYIGVIAAFVQGYLIRKAVPRFGESRLVVFGALCLGAAMLTIGVSSSVGVLLLALGLVALGSGLLNPSLSSLISRQTAASAQGRVLGVTQSLGSLARVVGPLMGGFLYSHFSTGAPYYAGGAMMLFASGIALHYHLRVHMLEPGSIPS